MECYIKFLPSVIKSLVQVSLPKSINQNGMIKFQQSLIELLESVCLPKSIGQNSMIH
jgi:hypothetical protein